MLIAARPVTALASQVSLLGMRCSPETNRTCAAAEPGICQLEALGDESQRDADLIGYDASAPWCALQHRELEHRPPESAGSLRVIGYLARPSGSVGS